MTAFFSANQAPLRVALAMLCSALPAQAQTNTQVYGRLNLGLTHYAGYGPGHPEGARLHSLSSRLGVKGSEDLGQGLQAIFMVESGFSADTGDGGLANREASVGLAGPWGQVKLGFMLSPLDDLHSIAGPGWVTSVTNDNLNGFWANGYSNLFAGGGTRGCVQVAGPDGNANSFAFDNRIGNSIRYDSPLFAGGWRFATQYALGESSCGARASSNKLQYQGQGWTLALAAQFHHHVRGEGLNDAIWMLAGGWQIAPEHYLGFWWQTLRYDNPGLQDLRQRAWGLNWRQSYGAHQFELAYYRAGAGSGAQTPVFSGIYTGADSAAGLISLGWRYKLSKRSELWAHALQLRNGAASAYELGAGGKAGAPGTMGAKPRALALGMKHDF
ncbi:porin [Massilia sp. W12]|uniref:porin n=1 Tax=Massilia sp. W12 TaxID=3126507 RepID=UPI0030D2F053